MTSPVAVGNPITIPVNSQPQQICPPVGGPVLIYNADITNVAYAGYNAQIAETNSCVIQPLAFTVMDGTRAIWGFCPTASVLLNVVPGGTSQSASPAQIAAQISALGLATFDEQVNQNSAIPGNMLASGQGVTTEIAALLATGDTSGTPGGVPLLNLYDLLTSSTSTNIAAGNEITLGPFDISQISYEMLVEAGTGQNAAVAPISVIFNWTDSHSGLQTSTQIYNFYSAYTGGGGAAHAVEGHGPSNADTLTVIIYSPDQAVTVAYALLQSSRNYLRHEWRTQNNITNNTSFPTQTFISCQPSVNILAAQQTGSLAVNGSITYLLPFYVGNASVYMHSATAAIGAQATLQDALTAFSSISIQKYSTIATGDLAPPGLATLPRDQCSVEIVNGTTAASNIQFAMIAQELQTA
jgi:hypothetical protein